jgi:hypothetical protein
MSTRVMEQNNETGQLIGLAFIVLVFVVTCLVGKPKDLRKRW